MTGGAVETNVERVFEIYASAVQAAVTAVAKEFSSAPMNFLYERDLQGLLSAKLYDLLAKMPVRWPVQESDWLVVNGAPERTIHPVKTEYPDGEKGTSTRFDVALLHPNFERRTKVWSQPVLVALEVKLRQIDKSGDDGEDDFKKLASYGATNASRAAGFSGASLEFYQRSNDKRLKPERDGRMAQVNPTKFELKPGQIVEWIITPDWMPAGSR
jgi:hypothetical protein